VERVELVAPAVAAEVAGVLGALLDIAGILMSKPKFAGTRSNQGNSNGSWLKPGGGSQLRGRPDSKLRGLVRSTRTSWISRLNSPPGPNRVSMPDEPVRPDGRPWQRGSEGSTADSYDKVCRRNRHPLILTVSGDF